jgi:hypothetical protein
MKNEAASCSIAQGKTPFCLPVQRMDKQGADAEQVDMRLFCNYANL